MIGDSSIPRRFTGTLRDARVGMGKDADGAGANRECVVTYREYVRQHLSPRELARAIVAQSWDRDGKRERIEAIYLSPDAFARRTDEASIAEQMGDIFAAEGLPRPAPGG